MNHLQATLGKVSMLCSILQAMFTKRNVDFDLETPKFLQLVCQIFVFAYLWSVGGNIHENDHEVFSDFVRQQFESEEYCKYVQRMEMSLMLKHGLKTFGLCTCNVQLQILFTL